VFKLADFGVHPPKYEPDNIELMKTKDILALRSELEKVILQNNNAMDFMRLHMDGSVSADEILTAIKPSYERLLFKE